MVLDSEVLHLCEDAGRKGVGMELLAMVVHMLYVPWLVSAISMDLHKRLSRVCLDSKLAPGRL